MATTKIEWTNKTWNPVTGCTKISDGCINCYAKKMAIRLKAMGQIKYKNGFNLTLQPEYLDEPLRWRKSQMIFVCSMSDLFHKDIPSDYILEVFKIMNKAYWHTFQILTKRPERLVELSNNINWTDNIWAGVTVESNKYINRIDELVKIPSKIRYLSLEPLLSDIPNLSLNKIDWIIVGGESGIGARPMKLDWVRSIRDQCLKANVPFFFKQWGGTNKKETGRELDGKIYNEMPKKLSKSVCLSP